MEDNFDRYRNKSFKPNDYVWVGKLGPSAPGIYFGQIIGIYASQPFESYIVKFNDHDKPPGLGHWDAVVVTKACIEYDRDDLK